MPRRILERKQPEVTEHWNNYITSSFAVCTLHKKIQEVKTGRTPGTHFRDKKCIKMYVRKSEGKNCLGEQGV
jgi:hypothetical protein